MKIFLVLLSFIIISTAIPVYSIDYDTERAITHGINSISRMQSIYQRQVNNNRHYYNQQIYNRYWQERNRAYEERQIQRMRLIHERQRLENEMRRLQILEKALELHERYPGAGMYIPDVTK